MTLFTQFALSPAERREVTRGLRRKLRGIPGGQAPDGVDPFPAAASS